MPHLDLTQDEIFDAQFLLSIVHRTLDPMNRGLRKYQEFLNLQEGCAS
jgi:hypothetical protein